MRDQICLMLETDTRNKWAEVRRFVSYSVDADQFFAAKDFSLSLFDPEVAVRMGQRCELYVNNVLSLRGIIRKVTKKSTKESRELIVDGCDLMDLLTRHCVTEFGENTDLAGMTLKQIVVALLADVPYIDKMKDVVYLNNSEMLSVPRQTIKIEYGQTVFDVLRTVAASRGICFWCSEKGKLTFGLPLSKGAPLFEVTHRQNGKNCNAIEAVVEDDIDEAFSKIYVYAQTQDSSAEFDDTVSNICSTATLSVPDEFPYFNPKVVQINGDSKTPSREAQRLANQARARSRKLEYTVMGHSQKGLNFEVNTMVALNDEVHGVSGNYLIYGRTFTNDKSVGPRTVLRLGKPGVVISD